ncbi:MAG: peptide/nickel transport system permease protein [Solirubrobacteraceae bacterium]|nr:peptide/nickel transport system permease protein [Solirubrobacteraceae bacterium]
MPDHPRALEPIRFGPQILMTVLSRLAQGIGLVVIVGAIAFAIPRWARPNHYVGETGVGGVLHAMSRAFLHLDFGSACGWPGCPSVYSMWSRGWVDDVSMLFGTVAIGVGGGFALGLWCAARSGSRRARIVEGTATVLYCTPPYVLGFAVLLLFQREFGHWPLPYFFDAAPVWASPVSSPWDWLRTLLVPWLVAATPLAAMCLRLVVALLREQEDADYVRTAIAKGVPYKRVIRRHAGPFAHAGAASLVGVSAPLVVTNLILVERVFGVPGFFFHTYKATGHPRSFREPPVIDFEMLAAIAVWAAVFIVVLSYAMDLALWRIDPRLRTAQRTRA